MDSKDQDSSKSTDSRNELYRPLYESYPGRVFEMSASDRKLAEKSLAEADPSRKVRLR